MRTVPNEEATPAGAAPETDQPPSRRFRILFTAAMILIALGYSWVWRAKTERVVAEPPPVLALAAASSHIREGAGEDGAAGAAGSVRLGDELLQALQLIRGLTVIDARTRPPLAPEPEQLLFAELRPGGTGNVLELRRVDAQSRADLYVYRVEGATFDEAVYRMSVQIAMSFGLPRPDGAPGDPAR